MKAMILAAGLGKRLRPLTANIPKPLLPLAGKPMIQHHIERLVAAGIHECVVNVSYRGQQIEDFLRDGRWLDTDIIYSREPDGPLETGGGIRQALPLLGSEPFLLVAADIWTDFPFSHLTRRAPWKNELAHLVLVPNPPQHSAGDFCLDGNGLVHNAGDAERLTYSGIALITPELLQGEDAGAFPLVAPLRRAADTGLIHGECWDGDWEDVGTVERYHALNQNLASRR